MKIEKRKLENKKKEKKRKEKKEKKGKKRKKKIIYERKNGKKKRKRKKSARSVRTRVRSLHVSITCCTSPFSWLGPWFVAARRVRSLVASLSARQAELVPFVDIITHRSVPNGSWGPFDIIQHAHAYRLNRSCQVLRHF